MTIIISQLYRTIIVTFPNAMESCHDCVNYVLIPLPVLRHQNRLDSMPTQPGGDTEKADELNEKLDAFARDLKQG